MDKYISVYSKWWGNHGCKILGVDFPHFKQLMETAGQPYEDVIPSLEAYLDDAKNCHAFSGWPVWDEIKFKDIGYIFAHIGVILNMNQNCYAKNS